VWQCLRSRRRGPVHHEDRHDHDVRERAQHARDEVQREPGGARRGRVQERGRLAKAGRRIEEASEIRSTCTGCILRQFVTFNALTLLIGLQDGLAAHTDNFLPLRSSDSVLK